MTDLQQQLSKALQAQQQQEREKALDLIVSLVGRLLEKASAYTKGVIAVGYAAILAAWGFAKDWMPPVAHAITGLLLILSVVIFVLWEVYANISSTSQFDKLVAGLNDSDPATAIATFQKHSADIYRRELRIAWAWRAVVIATLATGLAAASVIVVCVILHLLAELRAAI